MPAAYAAQLRQLLGATAAVVGARPLIVGDRVLVVDGRFQGLTGELEFVGAVRCQVRLDADDELASIPVAALEREPASRARAELTA
jgi:hypothetical protein